MYNVEPDELHVWHLGVSMYFLGSVLWVLVYRRMPHGASRNMGELWEHISAFYAEHLTATQFSHLNLSSFHRPDKPAKDYPKLKGKGAEVKCLVPALLHIWDRYRRQGDAHDNWVKDCLESMVTIQSVVDEAAHDLFLERSERVDASKTLRDNVDKFLRCYSRLGKAADEVGDLLWSAVPKLHWAWHWGDRSRFLSPRRGACFIDEDFVGRIKTIVTSVVHGSPAHLASVSVATKFRAGRDLMLQYP